MNVQATGRAPVAAPPAAFRSLISASSARKIMGVPNSTFWKIAHERGLTIVEYSAKVKRVYEDEVLALIEKRSVRGAADRARLADARCSR